MDYISQGIGKIPLRFVRKIDPLTGRIIEVVAKPHGKGKEIAELNKMLAEGEISRDTFARAVNGFFE